MIAHPITQKVQHQLKPHPLLHYLTTTYILDRYKQQFEQLAILHK